MAKNIDIKTLSRPQLKNLVKQISALGAPDDTELAHITKGEMDLLKSLGGSGHTDPDTGIKSFGNIFSKWLYGDARNKRTFQEYFGKGNYNTLNALNLSTPKTFKELQDFHSRKGKFKGLNKFSNTQLLNFLKFKEGGYGTTYKETSDWKKAIGHSGNVVTGQFNPMTALKENIDKSQSQILKDKEIASIAAGDKLRSFGFPDVGSASVGAKAQDTWSKGATAQRAIEKVASEQSEEALKDAQVSALGSFTNLYG
tara:strand:- start:302 stop:1066 length:765 start_codon:yes stop_codon:yes gene_type:complete